MEPSGPTSLNPFVVNRFAGHDVCHGKKIQQVEPRRMPHNFVVPDQPEKACVSRQRNAAESIGGRDTSRDQSVGDSLCSQIDVTRTMSWVASCSTTGLRAVSSLTLTNGMAKTSPSVVTNNSATAPASRPCFRATNAPSVVKAPS